jgi:hypothetical protein
VPPESIVVARPLLGDAAPFLVALVLGATFGLHRIIDPDVFLHVAVGRAIWRDPSALGVSTFVEAYPNYRYVEDKWLASLMVALADAVGGSSGLMLYQVALCALVAAAWYGLQRAADASPAVSLVGVSLALLICNFRLEPRPDTISHALLAVTMGIVVAEVPYRRLVWIVPVILALWVNLHGYFVNGLLVLLAAAVASALGDRQLRGRPGHSEGISTANRVVLFGLGLAACLLTPQGWHTLASPVSQIIELRRDPVFRSAIAEFSPSTELFREFGYFRWLLLVASLGVAVLTSFLPALRSVAVRQSVAAAAAIPWLLWPPPGLDSLSYKLFFALFLMALFEVPSLLRERRLIGPILLTGFTILAIPLVRNLPLLLPVTLLILAPAWTRAAVELGRMHSIRWGRSFALMGLLGMALVTGWLRLADRLTGGARAPIRTGWGVDTDRFPAAAAEFVESEGLPGPVLNNFDIGGYLLYHFHASRRVFIAGNTSMYPISFLQYYRSKVTGADADPDEVYERHGVRTVVIDLPSSATDQLLSKLSSSPSWSLVFLDRTGAVFLHLDDTTRPLAGRLHIDLDQRVSALVNEDRSAPTMPEWLGGTRLSYPSLNLGLFLGAIGRPDLVLREVDRLWDITPSEDLAIVGGQAALQVGRLPAEIPRLQAALARNSTSAPIKQLLFLGFAFRVDALIDGRALQEAERDLRAMQTLDPAQCGPYVGLAKVAALAGRNQTAKDFLAEANRRDADGACRARARQDPTLTPLM